MDNNPGQEKKKKKKGRDTKANLFLSTFIRNVQLCSVNDTTRKHLASLAATRTADSSSVSLRTPVGRHPFQKGASQKRTVKTHVLVYASGMLFMLFIVVPALPSTLHPWNFSRDAVWRGGCLVGENPTRNPPAL